MDVKTCIHIYEYVNIHKDTSTSENNCSKRSAITYVYIFIHIYVLFSADLYSIATDVYISKIR
jgi:hypothetical protein